MRAIKTLALLLFVVCLALPAAWAAEKTPYLEVAGFGSVKTAPDQVQVVVGFRNQALSAKRAAAQNARVMKRILAAIKPRLGPKDNLTTSSYRLSPLRQYDRQKRIYRISGYQVISRFTLTSRQPAKVAALVQAGSEAGANLIEGPRWSLADPGAWQARAMALAVKDARRKAAAMAAAAGLSLGPLLSLRGAGSPLPPRPVFRMRAMAKAAAPAPPLQPGRIEVSARVNCRWQLRAK